MSGKFSKHIIVLLIALTIIFTAAVLYLMGTGMDEPETLIKYWFTGFVSELFALAGIKITKIFRQYRSEEEDDEEEAVG